MIAVAAAVVLLTVGWVVAVNVYFNPSQDSLEDVDAVFVLGPVTPERMRLADEISKEAGGVPFLASKPGPCVVTTRTCVEPVPFDTKGEAAALRALAEKMGFTHPAVITIEPHVARARFIFRNCYGPDVSVVGVPVDATLGDMIYQIAYQTAAFVKAALTPCADPPTLPQ